MKAVKLLFLILLLPAISFCQTLTGLWIGSLTNDSSTIRKDQSFEMALTEYRGKVYGYSHTTFMVHDSLFYIVKRVKGTINGDICDVKDDEIISCNFLSKHDKGVKQIYTFRLNKADSVWRLDGEWKTNKTKNYYSISGSVKTAGEKDLSKSKLFPHLQELNLTGDVAAALPAPKKEPEPIKQTAASEPVVAKASTKTDTNPSQKETEKKKEDIAKTNKESEKKKEDIVVKKEAATVVTAPPVVSAPVNTAPKEDIAKTNKEPEKKKEEITVKKETASVVTAPAVVKTTPKNDLPVVQQAAVNVEKRRSIPQQVVDFTNDSLSIALYDNGEIDGDTVSVLINGQVILANQGLKATAIRKTVYIEPSMKDSFTLVLYAENLGKYPPNTGLMIVHDGDETYQVRFSADLQKNVAVIFKRKKK